MMSTSSSSTRIAHDSNRSTHNLYLDNTTIPLTEFVVADTTTGFLEELRKRVLETGQYRKGFIFEHLTLVWTHHTKIVLLKFLLEDRLFPVATIDHYGPKSNFMKS